MDFFCCWDGLYLRQVGAYVDLMTLVPLRFDLACSHCSGDKESPRKLSHKLCTATSFTQQIVRRFPPSLSVTAAKILIKHEEIIVFACFFIARHISAAAICKTKNLACIIWSSVLSKLDEGDVSRMGKINKRMSGFTSVWKWQWNSPGMTLSRYEQVSYAKLTDMFKKGS